MDQPKKKRGMLNSLKWFILSPRRGVWWEMQAASGCHPSPEECPGQPLRRLQRRTCDSLGAWLCCTADGSDQVREPAKGNIYFKPQHSLLLNIILVIIGLPSVSWSQKIKWLKNSWGCKLWWVLTLARQQANLKEALIFKSVFWTDLA